ncbi:MAG: hypothetical protein A2381_20260 [Bdellovibrionales bacterium RIFOXYB1_FULL_37_110]|nr:MAG: hypothetical protein A2181_03895 [Bdellovibrionales bacterium RIFOXYA1_FULL_38_20]OFZ51070.1 MAG: hypothetical protein A2417_20045 [Bdellovibrionales bacterium RIFOXYC1_FULL_37_79]OFZ60282.1 MAG: hypothetical protein A2381_20260 [Bdellovibrionales bacterium RIFOXYB1_FULL_37_110]OFZ63277.1 MAG: hypothetical protein A2577_01575 [Bdellovibrionales bacterium RIFOXYD1_FULL_36_51]
MTIRNYKTDHITLLLISILFGVLVLQTSVVAKEDEIIDIVFDLDWTLVCELEDGSHAHGNILDISRKKYRIANWAEEMLVLLASRPNVRLSFYSGGDQIRNLEILKEIILPEKNISVFDLAYKILSKDDMDEVSQEKTLRFSQRYKKNAAKINSNLNNVIIIDDVSDFTLASQKQNLLWLGPTFNHYDSYELVKKARKLDPTNKYIPKNQAQWKLNQDRLLVIYGILDEALEKTQKNGTPFVQNVQTIAKKYKLDHTAYNSEITKVIKKYKLMLKSSGSLLQACLKALN